MQMNMRTRSQAVLYKLINWLLMRTQATTEGKLIIHNS